MKKYQYITYYIKYLQYLVKLAIWKVRHGRHPSPPTTYLPLYQRKKFLAATFFLIFIAPAIIYLGLKAAKTAEAAWFDESYSYRQPFSFTHNADINAQRAITFSLDTAELITDGVMQSDCDDTRFTDINGKVLKYELTGTCNNAATTYEVIFESIINGSNVGYVYYGNSSAVSASIDSSGYTALTPSGGDPSITTRTNEEQSPGPAAYWKFDEGYGATANDSTSNANNGTITTATWQAEDMCISGKCLYFDGSADNVSISSAINISPNPGFTISHWVRTSSTGGQVYTVGNTGSGDGYRFGITAGKIAFLVGNSGGWNETTCGTNTVNDNQWHLITGIYTTSSFDCYIDGQFEASVSISDHSGMSTSAPGIGAPPCCTDFKGFLDDVKIYPYARTAAQIKTDYASRGSVKGTSSSFGSEDPNKSLSNGLVGYWNMDEASDTTTVTDQSGNGNTGSINLWGGGNTATSSARITGKYGGGIDFDGGDDYIEIDDSSELKPANITISTWINTDTTAGNDWIIDKDYWNGYSIYRSGTNIRFYGKIASTGGHNWGTTTGKISATAGWQHVVYTFDGATQRIYIDGNIEGTNTTMTGDISPDNNTLRFGVRRSGSEPGTYFDGTIDETRIYNRALSPRETRALYNWAPGPVGHWKMDEKAGTTANDSSGNNNTGTLTNSPSWSAGKYGGAVKLATDDRYVNVPTLTPNITNDSLTIESWVDMNLTGVQRLFLDTSNYAPQIGFTGTTLFVHTRTSAGDDLNSPYTTLPSNCQSGWHHIAVTWNASLSSNNVRAYCDGVNFTNATLVNSLNGTFNITGMKIGYIQNSQSINGSVDDMRIYNYARTSKQIIQDMNASHPLGGSPVGSQLSYWKFDEGYGDATNDSGFGGNNGTLGASTAAPSWTNDGKIGKALSFDGGDYTNLPGSSLDSLATTGDFTITTWNKQAAFSGIETVIAQAYGSHTYGRWLVGTNGSKGFVSLYGGASSPTYKQVTGSINLSTDTWNHITAVYSRTESKIKLYINGKFDSETAWDGYVEIMQANKVNLGYNSGPASKQYMNGIIDEVKIYNSALTADEVLLDMNQGSSVVMGALSTASDGTTASYSSDRSYCPPGDTTASCGPVAEWKLDENTGTSSVYDTSGNGYTGTMNGSMTESDWVQGKTGTALNFEGTDDQISFDEEILTGESAISVSGWFKTTDTNGGVATQYQNSSGYSWQLVVKGGLLKACVGTTNSDPDCHNNTWLVTSTASVNDDQWHHGALSYDGSNIYLYLDGQQVDSAEKTGTITQPTTNQLYGNIAFQGYDVGGGPVAQNAGYLSGSVDQVRLYNYSLSSAQIAWDYNRGKPVGHWKFDACQDTTAYDSSGNANHGTITAGDTSGSNDSVGTCNSGAGDEMWDNGTTGKRNYSLDFDGTNDYVDMDDITELNSAPAFTITLWINQDTLDVRDWLFSKSVDNNSRLGIVTWDNGNMYLEPDSSTNRGYFDYSTAISAGQWHHVTMVFDGSAAENTNKLKAFVDGVQQTLAFTGTIPATTPDTSGQSVIIGENTDQTNPYSGQIDDVQIFNYALTNQQIKSLYNSGALFFGPSTGHP